MMIMMMMMMLMKMKMKMMMGEATLRRLVASSLGGEVTFLRGVGPRNRWDAYMHEP